jgi:hypothetical protein
MNLPDPLQTAEFAAAWQDWLEYRKERKLPKYVPKGVQMQWKRLARWGPERAIAAIEYSIAQNYQGIFEEKQPTNGHATSATPKLSAHNTLSLNRTAAASYRQIGEKLRLGVVGNGQGDTGRADPTSRPSA